MAKQSKRLTRQYLVQAEVQRAHPDTYLPPLSREEELAWNELLRKLT